jgi:hypothetical protein
MSGPTTHRHRRRRPRKVGDLAQLRRMMWAALLESEHLLYYADTQDTALRAVHAIGTVGGAYAKLLEAVDIAERLKTLETQLAGRGVRQNGHMKGSVH